MRRSIVPAFAVVLLSTMALANTVVPLCSTVTTLEGAIGLPSGCTITDKTFANFAFNAVNGVLAATGVVTSFNQIGNNDFLTLTGAFVGNALLPTTYTIDYSVLATANVIEDLGVNLTNGNPLGPVTVNEFACVAATGGVSFTTSVSGTPTGCSSGNFYTFTADALNPIGGVTFTPSAFVLVEKQIELGASTGIASLSSLTNEVSQTPEPATVSLLVTGLIGLGTRLRRKKR